MKSANENGAQRSGRSEGGAHPPVPLGRMVTPRQRRAQAARRRPMRNPRWRLRVRPARNLLVGATFAAAGMLPITAVGAVGAVTPTLSGSWPYPNGDLANTPGRARLVDLVDERRQL